MAYFITDDCIGCMSCARLCPAGAIRGAKKERHAIAEDLCIECGTCGRICPKNAVEDPFGLRVTSEKKKDWKKPAFTLKVCMACGMCVDVCPVGCLALGLPTGKDKTAYPELINAGACLSCGFCVRECPVDAVTLMPPADEPMAKAV
ncbi:hypothetical protein JCM14469_18180 [Desulfatiferula olefinivorans]